MSVRSLANLSFVTASASLLAACDSIETRRHNFEVLTDKVIEQVNHDILGEPNEQDLLEQASIESRAISGRLSDGAYGLGSAEKAFQSESHFAVGSIIAKPKAVSIDYIAPASSSRTSAALKAPVSAAPLEEAGQPDAADASIADDATDPQEFSTPRKRMSVDRESAFIARERARTALDKLGIAYEPSTTDSGEMVIQIFVGPTAGPASSGGLPLKNMLAKRYAPSTRSAELDCASEEALARVKTDGVLATQCAVAALEDTGDYEYVEKDFIFSHQMAQKPEGLPDDGGASVRPDDPLWTLQWHFKSQGGAADQSPGGAGFADYWSRTRQTGSAGVTIAVVDTGLQMNHPDIRGGTNLAPGYDMVSDPFMGNDGDGRDANPDDPGDACDPSDPLSFNSYHGTHVAGTIGAAGTNNANGVAGGTWNVTIVPVRALGRCGGQLSDINDAIRWSAGVVPARDNFGAEIWNANPADIINLSIGLFETCPASLQDAIDDATDAGAIVVTAAGNARVDTRFYAPAGCRNVITVAASDARGVLAPYSNFGEAVDILAPGGDMSRDDDQDGRPDGILSTRLGADCYDPVTDAPVEACYYSYQSGTSMAAPHVTAALALLKSQFPLSTSEDLQSRLLQATSPRDQLQCSGECTHYPGTEPVPGEEGMCYRPCGGAILNLANAALD